MDISAGTADNHPARSSAYPKKIEHDCLALGYPVSSTAWLDVRVFYLRISHCPLEETPETLSVYLSASDLEMNGSKITFTDEMVLILRRDRMDRELAEVTYVSTDRLRTTGPLLFKVCDRDSTMICGTLQNMGTWAKCQRLDKLGIWGMANKGGSTGWLLDCKCTIPVSGCSFMKKKSESSLPSPSMEVYLAGRCCGAPVILTQSVELLTRKKPARRGLLDSIPEADELDKLDHHDSAMGKLTSQMEDRLFYEHLDDKRSQLSSKYGSDSYLEGGEEEGEMTWFNAGVRVGVSLGLGMCVGIGIGVGLMMRVYQATTRTFRRRFL